MKKLASIVLCLGSAAMACTGKDPNPFVLGGKRMVEARLDAVDYAKCCAKPAIRTSCDEAVRNREEALALLVVARGDCLDKAVRAIATHSPGDLAAAYLIRAEREDDPVYLLRALETARGFNRALAQERLGLRKQAIASWDSVVREGSQWAAEARKRRDALTKPQPQFPREDLNRALEARDEAKVRKIARAFPVDAARYFESTLSDLEAACLLADALAAKGELYPQTVMDAMLRTKDRHALDEGIRAFVDSGRKDLEKLERAAALLERAENPLLLAVQYWIAAARFNRDDVLPLLDQTAARLRSDYRELTSRIHTLRATALEFRDAYLQAHVAYEIAYRAAASDPTIVAAVLARRSENYTTIGNPRHALRDSVAALRRIDHVADPNARHHAYASAAAAAEALGYPGIALQYRTAAVEESRRMVLAAPGTRADVPKKHLAISLRARAEIYLALRNDTAARADLTEAVTLAEAAANTGIRDLLMMRLHQVRGEALLKTDPAMAEAELTKAIKLADEQHSTYQAVLHFSRAAASRSEADVATALAILREEARRLVKRESRGQYEQLWSGYFGRFQDMHHQMIESRLAAGDVEGALLYLEQARAFEPMQLLLQSHTVPPGFRALETREDLGRHLAGIRNDTVILQYLVLKERTYTWVLTTGRAAVFRQSVGREKIQRWVDEVATAVRSGQSFEGPMRAAYAELFEEPLARVASRDRLVIIPDGPMHGLPFAALQPAKDRYLVERASIATAPSASIHFYTVARDRQLARDRDPSVLLAGDPVPHPQSNLRALEHARAEVQELARDYYGDALVLIGADATVPRFLDAAKRSTIVHFAGHGVASPQQPWNSRLMLTPSGTDSGELTAERLMQTRSELEKTRLVILGACSTAGGQPVGPEGLAPLVRPLIAANVPAVVGTLWNVNDATTKDLLVSLHCHYRHGDDVAVALRKAQLERLRNNPMTWAAFQVVGHAESPYARPVALEEKRCDYLCAQNSVQRPDGLHPQ